MMTTSATHKHRAKTATTTSYVGQVPTGITTYVTEEAKGGIVITSVCSCGARRVDLSNGVHLARGRWVEP